MYQPHQIGLSGLDEPTIDAGEGLGDRLRLRSDRTMASVVRLSGSFRHPCRSTAATLEVTQMRRTRKLFLSIGLVCTTLIAVAACGANGPAATHSTATTAPPAAAAASPQAAAAALYRCESRPLAWDGSSAIDLTGTWAGDDSGVYYLRQLGDQVWWLGMSGLGGPLVDRGTDWTNVYHGTLKGDTVTGTYADVPGGAIQDKGPVVMKLTKTSDGGITLVNVNPVLDTGFGGKMFTPCKLG
jgi:predicted small lipoprotein YifL